MANKRTQLRNAFKTILLGNTDAGQDVYASQRTAFWQSEMPAILVYATEESAVLRNINGRQYIRTAHIVVECRVKATVDVDDAIDSLAGQVETLMDANATVLGNALTAALTNTEIRVDLEGSEEIGVGILTFECQYVA